MSTGPRKLANRTPEHRYRGLHTSDPPEVADVRAQRGRIQREYRVLRREGNEKLIDRHVDKSECVVFFFFDIYGANNKGSENMESAKAANWRLIFRL